MVWYPKPTINSPKEFVQDYADFLTRATGEIVSRYDVRVATLMRHYGATAEKREVRFAWWEACSHNPICGMLEDMSFHQGLRRKFMEEGWARERVPDLFEPVGSTEDKGFIAALLIERGWDPAAAELVHHVSWG